jgi:pimeloyl-ACP methyl ester carboxylesterase
MTNRARVLPRYAIATTACAVIALVVILLGALVPAGRSTAAGSLGSPTTLSIPHLHNDGTVAAVGNKVLFAGGSSYDGQTIFDTVDIYDAAVDHWTTASLSQPRHALTSVTIGTKVFFAGGQYDTAGDDSTRVDIFDSVANTWSTTELSEPRHYPSAVAVNGKVIIAGGWNSSGERSTYDIYDVGAGTWTSGNLPTPTSGDYQGSSVGSLALIADHDEVNIYDSQSGTWLTPHPLSAPRTTIAATTLGTKVIFAGGQSPSGNDAVDIFNSQTSQWQTATLSQARFTSPVTFNSRAYFVGGWTGSAASAAIDVYDGTSWTTESLPGPSWGDGPVVANGKLFVEQFGGSALVYGSATPAPTTPSVTTPASGKIAFVKAEPYVGPAAATSDQEIFVMNANGSGQVNVSNNTTAYDADPTWSPDGKKIAFTRGQYPNVDIYVMNANGSGQVNVSSNPAADFHPAWSPDGEKIAFVSDRGGADNIFVMNANGSGQANVSNDNTTYDDDPAWSPDGEKIAFSSITADFIGFSIFVMNANGSNKVNVSENYFNDTPYDEDPAWSPDGQRIAFSRGLYSDFEIYVMNADGSNQVNLSNNAASDEHPTWSPDGQKIAFASNREENEEIYVMNANGSGQANISDDPAYEDSSPDWSATSPVTPGPTTPGVTPPATLTVNITFSDNNPTNVLITAACNPGHVDSLSKNANKNAPAIFTVTSIPAVGTHCSLFPFGSPSGYDYTSTCSNLSVAPGAHVSCTIAYTLGSQPVTQAILYITGIASSGDCMTPFDDAGHQGWNWLTNRLKQDYGLADDSFIEYIYRDGGDQDGGNPAPDCSTSNAWTYDEKDACWSLNSSIDPGNNGPAAPAGSGNPAGQAEKLRQFIDQYILDHPGVKLSIVGHSQGGVLGAYLSAHYLGDAKVRQIHSIVTLDSPLQGINSAAFSATIVRDHTCNDTCGCEMDVRYDSAWDMLPDSSIISEIRDSTRPDDWGFPTIPETFTVDERGLNCQWLPPACEPYVNDAHSRFPWEVDHFSVLTGSHDTIQDGSGDQAATQLLVKFIECAIFGNADDSCSTEAYKAVLGDANGNGKVDSGDVFCALRLSAGFPPGDDCPGNGDANCDGKVDARDALLLLKVQSGLISSLAC